MIFFFPANLLQKLHDKSLKVFLGFHETKHEEMYLGLPTLVGKGKRASFNYWSKGSSKAGKVNYYHK